MTKTKLLLLALLASLMSAAQIANRYELVITEIMADPTPVVGLPNAEFVEVKNVSAVAFNLSGWKLSDASSTATINTSFVLQPDSMVILCANSNVAAFSVFGRTIGLASFPSLDNDGDVLTLRSPQNRVIHFVAYSTDWYNNEAKKDGGWTLEMIDPKNPCGGKENWKASMNNLGGTPGKINSVNGINVDNTGPQVKRAYPSDSVTIILVFNETIDSAGGSIASSYSMPGFVITSVAVLPPLFQTVQVKLASPLLVGNVYSITANNLADCKGNAIGFLNPARVALPQTPVKADIIINEILFNPRPAGFDFVELYNRSNKTIDASKLYIANRNTSGVVSSLKKLSEDPLLIFPGDYTVITEDAASLRLQYLVKNEGAVMQVTSLPSFPDDKGTAVVISLTGDILDELAYEDDWHFGLINNDEGVSLERLYPDALTQDKSNWHSAASTAGYGTPGYQNSQYSQTGDMKATITVLPHIFSPDNDGRDDIATINYQVEEAGYAASIIIFDAAGRIVRHLVKNDLLGLKGRWSWDGLGEKQNKLPIGTYVIFTEIFNLQGKKKSFKNTIVLARNLN